MDRLNLHMNAMIRQAAGRQPDPLGAATAPDPAPSAGSADGGAGAGSQPQPKFDMNQAIRAARGRLGSM